MANTATRLALSADFGSLDVVGETYEIRQHLTIGSLFGAANEAGLLAAGNSADADNLVLARSGIETFFFSSVPGEEGWKDGATGNAVHEPIDPLVPLAVRRRVTGNRFVYPTGAVRRSGAAVTLTENADTFVALPNCSAVALASLGLDDLVLRGQNPAHADNLLIFMPDGSVARCFYLDLGGFTGWYDTAYSPAPPVPAGSAIVFQRKGTGSIDWTIPAQP